MLYIQHAICLVLEVPRHVFHRQREKPNEHVQITCHHLLLVSDQIHCNCPLSPLVRHKWDYKMEFSIS